MPKKPWRVPPKKTVTWKCNAQLKKEEEIQKGFGTCTNGKRAKRCSDSERMRERERKQQEWNVGTPLRCPHTPTKWRRRKGKGKKVSTKTKSTSKQNLPNLPPIWQFVCGNVAYLMTAVAKGSSEGLSLSLQSLQCKLVLNSKPQTAVSNVPAIFRYTHTHSHSHTHLVGAWHIYCGTRAGCKYRSQCQ